MRDNQISDKDNGEIELLPYPIDEGFDLVINNFELAAGNGTKLDSKYDYQMMELREQIISIRVQTVSLITSQIIGNSFEIVEDLLDRSYVQIIKVLNNPKIAAAITSFNLILDKHFSYDKDAINGCQFEEDPLSNRSTLTTLPSISE